MATSTLVSFEIEEGAMVVSALESMGFQVEAALWFFDGEADRWQLLIAHPGAEANPLSTYQEAAEALAEWRRQNPDESPLDLSHVRIVGSDDRLIEGLKPIVGRLSGRPMRFSNHLVNGIYVEDAIIYRMAA